MATILPISTEMKINTTTFSTSCSTNTSMEKPKITLPKMKAPCKVMKKPIPSKAPRKVMKESTKSVISTTTIHFNAEATVKSKSEEVDQTKSYFTQLLITPKVKKPSLQESAALFLPPMVDRGIVRYFLPFAPFQVKMSYPATAVSYHDECNPETSESIPFKLYGIGKEDQAKIMKLAEQMKSWVRQHLDRNANFESVFTPTCFTDGYALPRKVEKGITKLFANDGLLRLNEIRDMPKLCCCKIAYSFIGMNRRLSENAYKVHLQVDQILLLDESPIGRMHFVDPKESCVLSP